MSSASRPLGLSRAAPLGGNLKLTPRSRDKPLQQQPTMTAPSVHDDAATEGHHDDYERGTHDDDGGDNNNGEDDDAEFDAQALQEVERDAIEAGRRMAQQQQQRLMMRTDESAANRENVPHHHQSGPNSATRSVTSTSAAAVAGGGGAKSSGSAAAAAAELETVRKNLIHANAALDKEKARTKDMQLSIATLQVEMTAMKRELAVVHRVSGPGGAGASAVGAQAKEIATLKRQLQLAQNEIDGLKQREAAAAAVAASSHSRNNNDGDANNAAVATAHSAPKHSSGTSDENVARLRGEVRSLESQRAELLNVVKKQNRLIDVLRRQKMHLEAAKMLQITEDEFRRALQMQQ